MAHQAVTTNKGELRDRAAVCEVTELMDLVAVTPSGTRCIVRREPLHQGAQRTSFPSLEFRFVALLHGHETATPSHST